MELHAKNKILAQNFKVYKKQREKMTYEDEPRKSGIFSR